MQRHGRDQVRFGDQIGPCRLQPAREERGRLQPACVLIGEQDRAAGVVIGERGAGAVVAGRVGRTGAAKIIAADVFRQQAKAAALATRVGDETEISPARAADRLGGGRFDAAGKAARGNEQVERVGERPRGSP